MVPQDGEFQAAGGGETAEAEAFFGAGNDDLPWLTGDGLHGGEGIDAGEGGEGLRLGEGAIGLLEIEADRGGFSIGLGEIGEAIAIEVAGGVEGIFHAAGRGVERGQEFVAGEGTRGFHGQGVALDEAALGIDAVQDELAGGIAGGGDAIGGDLVVEGKLGGEGAGGGLQAEAQGALAGAGEIEEVGVLVAIHIFGEEVTGFFFGGEENHRLGEPAGGLLAEDEEFVFGEDGEVGFSVLIEIGGDHGAGALEGLEVAPRPCFGKAGGFSLKAHRQRVSDSRHGHVRAAIAVKITGNQTKVPLVGREGDFLKAAVFQLRLPAVARDGPLRSGHSGAAGHALVEKDEFGVFVINERNVQLPVAIKIRRCQTTNVPCEAGHFRAVKADRGWRFLSG